MKLRLPTLAAAFAVAALFAGCGERPEPMARRLIDDLELDPSAVESARRPVFSWDFETAADLEPWTLSNLDGDAEPTDRGLAFFSTTADPHLWRPAGFDAASVDTIRIRIAAAAGFRAGEGPGGEATPSPGPPGKVQLFWAGPMQQFSESRQVAVEQPTRSLDDGSLVYELPVALDPSWSGRIERLRVDPTNRYRMAIVLTRVEGLPPEAEGVAVRRVEIDSEQRPAVRAEPGVPLRVEVEVPAGAVLRFGYGLSGEPPAEGPPVELRVTATASDPPAAALTLFETAWPEGRDAAWRQARVDLGDFAGRRLVLRFESSAPAGIDALPVIANPEVYVAGARRRQPNVLLISLDTLRADRLSLYGYRHRTSPAIDAWAREQGVTFEKTVAPSPWTLPSHVSMFTGLDALAHGVNHLSTSMSPDLPSLTGLLRRAGYHTAAITGSGFVGPGFGIEHHFDRFRWWPHEAGGADEIDTHIETVLEWLEELSDRPFFLFFHTYEVHSPYLRRRPHFKAFGGRRQDLGTEPLSASSTTAPEIEGFKHRSQLYWAGKPASVEPAALSALYDAGIAHADAVVGRLLKRLRRLDLAADTIVVLTSDHGESLGEHGLYGHNNLYDDNLLVPLVISYPRRLPAAGRVERQVRLIDLMPTVLDLAGVETPPGLDGESLVPLATGDQPGDETPPAWAYAGFPNFGLAVRRDNALKYIFNDALWPAVCAGDELYQLDRDAAELDDKAEVSEHAGALRRQLQGHLRRHAAGLILEIANRGAEPFDLDLSGGKLLSWTVKWLAGACPRAQRLEDTVRITVAPDESTTLVWQRALRQRLTLTARIAAAGGSERRESVTLDDPRSLTGGRTLHDDGRRWQWVEGRVREPWTGVRVWWRPSRGAAATTESPEMLEQLEALGYLQ